MTQPTAYAVLLRAVNLGPHQRVPSAELRAAAADAGLGAAKTYASSGNVVVTDESPAPDAAGVVARLATALRERVGFDVDAVALDEARLAAIVAANPFTAAARDDPSHLVVHVGPEPVDPDEVARLDLANPGRELLAVAEGVLYVHYVDGIGRSSLGQAQLARTARSWTTGRNWNTVMRLLDMMRAITV